MYKTERLKHLIAEACFDGWIENDGKNCDWDHKTQLLKETDAIRAIAASIAEAPTLKNRSKDKICFVVPTVEDWETWFEIWFGSSVGKKDKEIDK